MSKPSDSLITSKSQHDPLETEVSLQASLDASGIKGTARSRAVSAIDSLIGTAIEAAGGAYLDGLRRRQRARDAVKEQRIIEEGQQDLEDLRTDRAGLRLKRDLLRKQEAREAIASATIDHLRALPLPEAGTTSENASIDPDWMNSFNGFSENASSDDLRDAWARVLAGEIVKPGTFSRSTLRAISELDLEVAQAFQTVVEGKVPSGWLIPPERQAWNGQLRTLIDAGLVQPQTFSPPVREDEHAVWWLEEGWGLRLSRSASAIKLPLLLFSDLLRLSRTGIEIASIFPATDTRALVERLGRTRQEGISRVELVALTTEQANGMVNAATVDVLFDAEASVSQD